MAVGGFNGTMIGRIGLTIAGDNCTYATTCAPWPASGVQEVRP
jgi:hypothetical protein